MDKTEQAAVITEAGHRRPVRTTRDQTGLLAGASVLASACCIVPLVLFSLGIGSVWMANFTALAPYKPVFLTIASGLILAGFVSMRRRWACEVDGYCASGLSRRITAVALWFSMLLVIAVLLWPYLLPILMGE